tara:strand:- start:672 stop:962 length:291 start_codon:yes stop_codon:yes gene_type:complete
VPYIKPEKRKLIKTKIEGVLEELEVEGDYNYTITLLIHNFVRENGLCYDTLNRAEGILGCANKEFYRTVVAPYEDIKRAENGPVSELDDETNTQRN